MRGNYGGSFITLKRQYPAINLDFLTSALLLKWGRSPGELKRPQWYCLYARFVLYNLNAVNSENMLLQTYLKAGCNQGYVEFYDFRGWY